MPNKLGVDLLYKYVILTQEMAMALGVTQYEDANYRVFFCKTGNGLKPENMGRAIFGYFITDPTQTFQRIDAVSDIEREATPEEREEAVRLSTRTP